MSPTFCLACKGIDLVVARAIMRDPFHRGGEALNDLLAKGRNRFSPSYARLSRSHLVEETNFVRRCVVSEYSNDIVVFSVGLEGLEEIGACSGIKILDSK